MTSETISGCALALTPDDLSTWLDGSLAPEAATRIAVHVAGCVACQRRREEYRAIAEALRAIAVPEPAGGYGRNPRTRTAASGSRGLRAFVPVPRPSRRVRLGGGLAALAAALLVALSFAQLLHGFTGHTGVVATPVVRAPSAPPAFATATPVVPSASTLTWRAHQLPVASGATAAYMPTLAFAQSDGSIAYECANPPEATGPGAQVWLTRDGAAHWQRVGDLRTAQAVDACTITVNTSDPAIAVAATHTPLPANCGGCFPGTWTDFVTFDYGAHWASADTATLSDLAARAAGDSVFPLSAFTSYQGAVYALHIARGGGQFESPDNHLLVSRDGMRTWARIDRQLPTSGLLAFWMNPANGSMLVIANPTHSVFGMQLWTSDDGGGHWRLIAYPFGAAITVQVPFAAQPWHICLWDTSTWNLPGSGINSTNMHTQDLTCTADSGATWRTRHIANLASYTVTGIADDGAVLLTDVDLYRLAPGEAGLHSLGPLPADALGQSNITYVAAGGGGVLWAGPFGPSPFGNVLSQPGPLYTAAYA